MEDRLRVGIAHERIGLSTKWYLGAYRRYMQDVLSHLFAELDDTTLAREAFISIQKLVYLDMVLASDTYLVAKRDALDRHRRTGSRPRASGRTFRRQGEYGNSEEGWRTRPPLCGL